MGKKKVGKEDQATILTEAGKVETAVAAASSKTVNKRVERGNVYVKAR